MCAHGVSPKLLIDFWSSKIRCNQVLTKVVFWVFKISSQWDASLELLVVVIRGMKEFGFFCCVSDLVVFFKNWIPLNQI
jgi:hypothetical protein